MTLTPGDTTHRGTLRWQQARVLAVRDETARARTFRLALPDPRPHLAGQHYVVRLTAPDGYTASRSYSVATPYEDSADGRSADAPRGADGRSADAPRGADGRSADAPRRGEIELTVERLDDGEVSGHLHEVVEPGDELEVRGPIGGFFAWAGDTPALLVGGGSGVVPLMAMLRQARRDGRAELLRTAVSARTPDDLYYATELPGPGVTIAFTRFAPAGDPRPVGRLRAADLAPLVRGGEDVYVCGSPAFADSATALLVEVGVPVGAIRVERFGPSG